MQTTIHKIMEMSMKGSNLINKWHIQVSQN